MDPRASGGVHFTRDLLGLWQLEPAAVGATFALRLISLLVYVGIELPASSLKVQASSGFLGTQT
jgi:hypothetical protein